MYKISNLSDIFDIYIGNKKYRDRDLSTFGSTEIIFQKFNILNLGKCANKIPDIGFSCFPANIYQTDFQF
jgi:hypothetical protein